MTQKLAVFRATGAMDRLLSVPDFLVSAQQQSLMVGEYILAAPEWVEFGNAYSDGVGVLARTELNLTVSALTLVADATDTVTISGIPLDVTVRWPDGVETTGDNTAEFSVDLPGTYTFRFTGIPYLDQEVTLEAVAAA